MLTAWKNGATERQERNPTQGERRGQTLGTGDYRYEEVEDWTQVDFEGVASDMATICDHIAGSVSMEMGDFQCAPFNQQGGLGKAYELFGDELPGLLEELNLELVA